MSAQTVWRCIKIYRTGSFYSLLSAFSYSDGAAIAKLEDYAGKDVYHGHGTGGPGDKEAPNATTNLNNAIAFLRANVPEDTGSGKKGPNLALKRINEKRLETMYAIINDENLELLAKKNLLAEIDPNWTGDKKLAKEYDRVKAAKLEARKAQRK
jgi:hypothetical protein